jgi:hypothetical protein
MSGTTTTDDSTQLTIEHLALSEAELRERLASVEADRDTYRELAQLAINELHRLTAEMKRANDQHHWLRDQIMREALEKRQAAA